MRAEGQYVRSVNGHLYVTAAQGLTLIKLHTIVLGRYYVEISWDCAA